MGKLVKNPSHSCCENAQTSFIPPPIWWPQLAPHRRVDTPHPQWSWTAGRCRRCRNCLRQPGKSRQTSGLDSCPMSIDILRQLKFMTSLWLSVQTSHRTSLIQFWKVVRNTWFWLSWDLCRFVMKWNCIVTQHTQRTLMYLFGGLKQVSKPF